MLYSCHIVGFKIGNLLQMSDLTKCPEKHEQWLVFYTVHGILYIYCHIITALSQPQNNIIIFPTFSQWSFGITCWEVFTAGRLPYAGVVGRELLKMLKQGERLEKPENSACSQVM